MLPLRLEINKSRMVLLVALLFTALGASVFATPPILFMAAVLCGAPLAGSVLARLCSRGIRLRRQFPTVGSVGDVVTARFTLSNRGPLPAFLVHCRCEEDKTGAFEREREGVHVEPFFLPRSSVSWEESWRLTRRGSHHLPRVSAGALDPLGLVTRLSANAPSQEILILPRPLRIGRLGWSGGGSGGVRPPLQAARVADAADFHGIRAHRSGEGIRRIHWKSTARTQQLHVIEWEEEVAADLTLFLDVQAAIHAGAPHRDSLESLVTVAATIAGFLLESGHRFGMMWCEDAPAQGAPRLCRYEARNLGGLATMLSALAMLRACSSRDATLAHLVGAGLRFVPQEQGALLVTTDKADLEAALRLLTHSGNRHSGRHPQTLIFDAASFQDDPPRRSGATAPPRTLSKAVRTSQNAAFPSSNRIRQGDSLVEVLERGA